MRFAGNKIFLVLASILVGANASGAVELGIDVLESNGSTSMASVCASTLSLPSEFDFRTQAILS
jgi:hypothetical protein